MLETKPTKSRRKDSRLNDDEVAVTAHEPTPTPHKTQNLRHSDNIELHKMVEVAAYYRAVHRGFTNGSPEQDWLEAEREVLSRTQQNKSKHS